MARVLIVDDNASVLHSLGYYLQATGHTVDLANNGSTGLCRAIQSGIEIVLLDIEMPDISGIAVCRAIKSNPALRELPVILMTGRTVPEIINAAMAAGAALVMAKPFDLQELSATIARFVAATELAAT
jgi:two-component system, OmpR family, response regulator ArlR